MVKIPLYKLNGMRKTKMSKLKLFNISNETNEEDGENNDQEEQRYSDINYYSKENLKQVKEPKNGIKYKIKYINKNEEDED